MRNVDPIRPKGNSFHIKNFNPTACRLDELHHCNSRVAPGNGPRAHPGAASRSRSCAVVTRSRPGSASQQRTCAARAVEAAETAGARPAAAAAAAKKRVPPHWEVGAGPEAVPLGGGGSSEPWGGGSRPRRARRPRRWNPPGSPSATRIEERSRRTTDKTDFAAGGFAARPGYSAWPVRARRTSTSTGTSAVDVVGRDDRPPRSNCCPVARPPSHTEITAMSAPAMSSAM